MLTGYLRLLRFPLAPTAIANVVAGYVVAHGPTMPRLLDLALACVASVLIYTGGMILNDVYDAPRDKARGRPRPIPEGLIRRRTAGLLGLAHLLLGVLLVTPLGGEAILYAVATAALAFIYDAWARRWITVGVLVMGLARGANVLIGVGAGGGWQDAWDQPWLSHIGDDPLEVWLHPAAICLYTVAVTLESLREDHLGRRGRLRLPFNLAFYCLPAALGSLMCDREMPVAQLFWIFPALLGLANGRAYAARPSLSAARRTVRDGLLAMPCMDAVVVSTVVGLGNHSVVLGLLTGGGIACLGLVGYGLMRLATPAGRAPTADDALEDPCGELQPALIRFAIVEHSRDHLALADGHFQPGGSWQVMRCEVPAPAPVHLQMGLGEMDPELPGVLPARLRPLDARQGQALVEVISRTVGLAVPEEEIRGGAGFLDLHGRLLAEGVTRCPDGGGMIVSESGDWSYYELCWAPADGGSQVTIRLGLNPIVGVGELSFPAPGPRESAWVALVTALIQEAPGETTR